MCLFSKDSQTYIWEDAQLQRVVKKRKLLNYYICIMNILQYKDITASVKDVDVKGRIVTGYLSNFGNKDFDGDIIEKGAFKKTLTERKSNILFLNQHDWKQPHGGFTTLIEDEKGLYFESTPLVKGVTYSEDALKLYEAGIIKEHSIGFVTINDEYDDKSQTRYIKEIKLYEGSNVTMGSNSNTPFTGFKGMNLKDMNDRCSVLYKAIRNGDFTDDTFVLLEYALKELQLQAYELGKNTQTEPQSTLETYEPLDTIKQFINTI